MKDKYYILVGFCSLLLAITFSSCKHKENEYHSITDKIEAESKHYKGTTISSEKFIEELHMIEITEGVHTFLIPERKSQIKSYDCTECHSKPLVEMQRDKEAKKAHWNVRLLHADTNTMNCGSCHDGSSMDNLTSLTGNSVDFNLSYQVCAQCHTKQFQDWKGGAHGKGIESWAPPRASMTCVNCHNPHDPGFDTRWPAKFNTQTEKERQ